MITISQCTKSLNSKASWQKEKLMEILEILVLLLIFKKPIMFLFTCSLYLPIVLETVWDSDYLPIHGKYNKVSFLFPVIHVKNIYAM